jgi:hypothetical protein
VPRSAGEKLLKAIGTGSSVTSVQAGVPASWASSPVPLLSVAILALNIFVCWDLFRIEYLPYMGSADACYISVAHQFRIHPRDLNWFPLWYGGVPFQNTYPPLLPAVTAGVSACGNISPARAYHVLAAAFYCFGPVALFWLALRLSGQLLPSFFTAVLYSILSPSVSLVQTIARETPRFWTARRLWNLVVYGDGPHQAALALLPVALLLLDFALRKTTPLRVLVAALSLAAVALTNWIGALSLALAILALLLARADAATAAATIAKILFIALLAYLFVTPWLPPSTIRAIRRNSELVEGSWPVGAKQVLAIALIALAAWILRRFLLKWAVSPAATFACLWLLTTGAIVVLWDRFGVPVIPQPLRYHLELDVCICLAAGAALAWLFNRLRRPRRLLFIAALSLAATGLLWAHRHQARRLLKPVEIPSTVEYQAASWLREHLPGSRVFAVGSVEYWLNTFSDNPQLGGGFGQGVVNPRILDLRQYLFSTSGNGPESMLWLQAYGARAVFVGGRSGREFFKAFRDPTKFHGVLSELWRSGDDVIYAVPGPAGLAHVLRPGDVVASPQKGFQDVSPLRGYLAALADPHLPAAELEWHGSDRASIHVGALEPHQLVSVQISYHPGWRAFRNGARQPIRSDGLGFMVIEPACSGDCRVELVYDGGLEMKLARLASIGTFLCVAGWCWTEKRARRPLW